MRFWPLRLSICVLLLLYTTFCAAADLDSAIRAYHQRNFTTAVKEFTELAEHGNYHAQLILGKMYMLGQGVPKNSEQAIKWFRASAIQGDSEAQFFLGAMYLLPEKNVGEGLKWLRLSAEQGDQDAQFLLGRAYLKGQKELPRDPVQGVKWLSLAAKGNKQFYQDELRSAERLMTADERTKANALAAAWKPKPWSSTTTLGNQ